MVTPEVNVPGSGVFAADYTAAAGTSGPAGSPLQGNQVVVGLDGAADQDLVIVVTTDSTGTTIDPTFNPDGSNNGQPVVIERTTGTTSVGGVAVDEDGNIFVSANVNGKTVVLGYGPNGAPLTNFGSNGTFELDGTGAFTAGNIDIVDGRVIVSSAQGGANAETQVRAIFTPAGFNALPVAVSSTVAPAVSQGSPPAPFTGPIIQGPQATTPAVAGGNVTLRGSNLAGVSAATINGLAAEVISATAEELSLRLPAGLTAGVYDLVVTSPQGTVTIQGAIRIQAGESIQAVGNGQWTKATRETDGSIKEVKIYAKNPVGLGKIQFFQNGREIAWVRAVDNTDPKLRTVTSGPMAGTNYLVRTVTLLPGKNALEIYVDGVRVWRAAYTLR